LGFADEAWWSREKQPALHTWTEEPSLRLVEQKVPKTAAEAKAVACYGLYLPALAQMLVRFVVSRPVSQVTCAFLAWLLAYLAGQGKRAVAEPARLLSIAEIMQRVCAYFHSDLLEPIAK